ncbi:hypothetical protein Ahy_B03g062441 isoform B [Arachis hypogaea]|uniref:Uncharacterized protein n=1 Tax=Arachis hypogaea TaxID=3818 RepID=A0A444ZUM1_ARAHY|nr:hypothetical protein Ahy_B03g062441 isoform B [Arachis hypogaea]
MGYETLHSTGNNLCPCFPHNMAGRKDMKAYIRVETLSEMTFQVPSSEPFENPYLPQGSAPQKDVKKITSLQQKTEEKMTQYLSLSTH